MVSYKVTGIKDSSKTVLNNWDIVSKYDLGRHRRCGVVEVTWIFTNAVTGNERRISLRTPKAVSENLVNSFSSALAVWQWKLYKFKKDINLIKNVFYCPTSANCSCLLAVGRLLTAPVRAARISWRHSHSTSCQEPVGSPLRLPGLPGPLEPPPGPPGLLQPVQVPP